jgi:hypothetical protein
LRAEAAAERDRSTAAQAEAADLARQAVQLQDEAGAPRTWWATQDQARQAEAHYDRDRDAAQQADQGQLHRLREQITYFDTAATRAGGRSADLAAEKTTRATMPDHQRDLEDGLRSQWTVQHLRDRADRLAERTTHSPTLDHHHRSIGHDIHHTDPHRGIDRGPHLGM